MKSKAKQFEHDPPSLITSQTVLLLQGLNKPGKYAVLQEPDTSFLCEDMRELLKTKAKGKDSEGGQPKQKMPLDSLLEQLTVGHSEWFKFLGKSLSKSESSALQRAALDRTMTAPALADVVIAS